MGTKAGTADRITGTRILLFVLPLTVPVNLEGNPTILTKQSKSGLDYIRSKLYNRL
jgi:hypothetical protein